VRCGIAARRPSPPASFLTARRDSERARYTDPKPDSRKGHPAMSNEEDLGKVIFQSTPYSKMDLIDDWDEYIEWDNNTVFWNFREVPRRIRKAIRIPVQITIFVAKTTDTTGNKQYVEEKYLDWLVIGYEGGGGM